MIKCSRMFASEHSSQRSFLWRCPSPNGRLELLNIGRIKSSRTPHHVHDLLLDGEQRALVVGILINTYTSF